MQRVHFVDKLVLVAAALCQQKKEAKKKKQLGWKYSDRQFKFQAANYYIRNDHCIFVFFTGFLISSLQALEEVEKNFLAMRVMLCGDGEVEPNLDQVSQLALEICKEDVLALFIHKLPILGWEVSYHNS